MRILATLLALAIFPLATAEHATAQATVFGAGCGTRGSLSANGAPRIGNAAFGVNYTAPAQTVVSFWFIGLCHAGAPPDYPTQLCGTGCAQAVVLNPFPVLDAFFPPPLSAFVPLPIPPITQLVGLEACMQFLNYSGTGCLGISDGMRIVIQA